MYQKLKECKTLKEIFTLIGDVPFQKVAFVVVMAWILLPIYAIGQRVYWYFAPVTDYGRLVAVQSGYQLAAYFLGAVSLYVAVFFWISRISIYGKGVWQKIKAEPWHYILFLMLLWACISTLNSEYMELSYTGDSYHAEGLRMYWFYAGLYTCTLLVAGSKRRWNLLKLFNIVSMVMSFIIIIEDCFDFEAFDKCFDAVRSAVFFHFNHAGYFLAMGIACAMGLYLYESRRVWRIWYAFSIAFQIYGILVNSTLGSFLGNWGALLFIIAFFIRYTAKFSWRILTPVVITIAIIIASYCGYVPTTSGQDMKVNFETLFSDGEQIVTATDVEEMSGAGHGRMYLWITSLKMIPNHPIIGYGPNVMDGEIGKDMWVTKPDNELIQYAVFLGIPGLLFYVVAMLVLFIHQWKHMKRLDSSTLIAAGCMVAYLGSSMFGVTTFYTTPYLFMFWAMAAGRPQQDTELVNTKSDSIVEVEKELITVEQ